MVPTFLRDRYSAKRGLARGLPRDRRARTSLVAELSGTLGQKEHPPPDLQQPSYQLSYRNIPHIVKKMRVMRDNVRRNGVH